MLTVEALPQPYTYRWALPSAWGLLTLTSFNVRVSLQPERRTLEEALEARLGKLPDNALSLDGTRMGDELNRARLRSWIEDALPLDPLTSTLEAEVLAQFCLNMLAEGQAWRQRLESRVRSRDGIGLRTLEEGREYLWALALPAHQDLVNRVLETLK